MTPLRPTPTPPALAPEATALAAYHLLDVPVAWADTSGRLLGANAAFEAAIGSTTPAMKGQAITGLLGLQPDAGTNADTSTDSCVPMEP